MPHRDFTDESGREWEVIDFVLKPPPSHGKKRVETGSLEAQGRAFHRPEETRIYWFGQVAYRDTERRTLANQFANAKPTTVSAARQHWDR